MPIIIGLGTGRSGTQSLAQLIHRQPGAVCFHEINPSCMKWAATPATVRSMIAEFRAVLGGGPREITLDFTRPAGEDGLARLRDLPSVAAIGDVASYYLSYAEMLLDLDAEIRMPCLQRDRAEVIESFVRAVRVPVASRKRGFLARPPAPPRRRNHWMDHDGTTWVRDPKWDSLFPKFAADTLEDAIGQYWDFYTGETARLAAAWPERVRVFDLATLNTDAGQRDILDFCGVPGPHVVQATHLNALAP